MQKPYIISGYRIGFNTKRSVFKSIFMLHNETSNTWTHIIGALLFIWFLIYVVFFMCLPSISAFPSNWCPASTINKAAIDEFLNNQTEILHPEPNNFHSLYNHHGEAFERVELMIQSSLSMLERG